MGNGSEGRKNIMKKIRTSASVQFISAAIAVAGVLAFISCSPKQVKLTGVQAAPPVVASTTTPAIDVTEASLRGVEFSSVPELVAIRFDYDSAKLSVAALSTLKKNVVYLKEHANLDVLVTGNCDQRGTIEYNLALGQRRAKSVRGYYIRLGISGQRIATLSYGKEKPVCSEMTESCWAQNRRAETLARAKTVAKTQDQPSQSQ